jgi:hypothetical protein
MSEHDEHAPTSPPKPTAQGGGEGAWGAVARLLSVQLLTVIAVTAVITGIYTLAGGHHRDEVAVGSSAPATTTGTATTSPSPSSSAPPSPPPASNTTPASPTPSQPAPEGAARLKVDVLNQSGPGGTAAKTATRVRALGWTVGRVADFHGNVSTTTIYYPKGEGAAAHELAAALPGKPRVLPGFSTLSDKRLTIIITD